MDKNQELSLLTYTRQTLPPAQLFLGHHDHAVKTVERLLQKMLCAKNCDATCITCLQIRNKQHHAVMWLHPEKQYTIEQLDHLFTMLSLQLQTDDLFFFIIQKADFLTSACANKLLKPMEEPPAGYHFILLAERAERIVPTIWSRCIVHTLENSNMQYISHPIVEVFTKKLVVCADFSKILDTSEINERESIELLDQILHYWFTTYSNSAHKIAISSIITQLQKAQLRPPMPGSTTIFWRNLYLQVHHHLNSI